MYLRFGPVREPLSQALKKQSPGKFRQFKGLHEPRLGGHPAQSLNVYRVIRTLFDLHTHLKKYLFKKDFTSIRTLWIKIYYPATA
jgi:hypothetical protein